MLCDYLPVTEIRHTNIVEVDDFPDIVHMSKLVISGKPVRHQHVNDGMDTRNTKGEIILRSPDYRSVVDSADPVKTS